VSFYFSAGFCLELVLLILFVHECNKELWKLLTGGVWIVVDSMDMKFVHIMTSNGKTDLIAVGKVKKTSIHGIHHIINTMESMNTNHLNKRNPNKD
jgi:hypothetical protein